MTKNTRTRNWTIVVYPESAPKDWKDILDNMHIGWVCSPLHEKDVNPDGTKKKPHWHIVLIFQNLKSYDQILSISKKLHAPIPKRVEDLKGMIRYLIHLDNPEKYQYDRKDIEVHGGVEIDQYFDTKGNRLKNLKDMVSFIQDNQITSMSQLAGILIQNGQDEWFDILANHNTLFLKEIIKEVWRGTERKKEIERNQHRDQEINRITKKIHLDRDKNN